MVTTRAFRVVAAALPPLVALVVFVLLWDGAVRLFDWKPYFLPKPGDVWTNFVDSSAIIRRAARVTGSNAIIGLAVGVVAGVLLSFVMARYRWLDDIVNPIAIAVNAVPIIVLVAAMTKQYPAVSQVPRRVMVALVVYFVVLVNVTRGLREVRALHVELMRSYAASPLSVLLKVRLPNALPYLFTALRIAAPLAVVTAFVAEYFGGTQDGLGQGSARSFASSRSAAGLAYVLASCLLGLVFYLIALGAETVVKKTRGESPEGEPT